MRKLRHALTGATYEVVEGGLVRVEHDGREGLFRPDGTWHSGELRDADPHMIGWVGGPQLKGQSLLGRAQGRDAPAEGDR
jgi:hypothetical protein